MDFRAFMAVILRDERGATAIEYGLIVSMIVIAMIAAMQGFANSAIEMWEYVEDEVVKVRPS